MNARPFGYVACALLLGGSLCACSGGSVPSATPTPSAKPTATPSPSPPLPRFSIFVANGEGNSITVYAPNPSGTMNETPLATIAGTNTGLDNDFGLAVDARGKIYVTNNAGAFAGRGSITVYGPDPRGTLNEAPLATIAGDKSGILAPYGIALDASGKIYVAFPGGNNISVYAANPIGSLDEAPLAVIAGNKTGLDFPKAVAVDASGKIYVSNVGTEPGTSSITVYGANPKGTLNEAPLATITGINTGLNDPNSVAVDSHGKIYATNIFVSSNGPIPPTVTVYAANPSGVINEAPIATITGSSTGLNDPSAIAVDASEKIYVGNDGSLTVYAPNPTGTVNEAPIGTISGGNTGIGATSIVVH